MSEFFNQSSPKKYQKKVLCIVYCLTTNLNEAADVSTVSFNFDINTEVEDGNGVSNDLDVSKHKYYFKCVNKYYGDNNPAEFFHLVIL